MMMNDDKLEGFMDDTLELVDYKEKYAKLTENKKGILDFYMARFGSELGDDISLQLLERISREKFWLYSGDTFKMSGAEFKLVINKGFDNNCESSVIAIKNKSGVWKPIGLCQSFKHIISPKNESGLNVIELVFIRIDPHETRLSKTQKPNSCGFSVMTDVNGDIVFDTFHFTFSTVDVEYRDGDALAMLQGKNKNKL